MSLFRRKHESEDAREEQAPARPDSAAEWSEPVSILIDNLGPTIRLRKPLEGQTLSGRVTISVEVEDSVSGVSLVELEISDDAENWRRIAEARERPFDLHWDSEALENGACRLRIRARDGSGNLSLIGPLEVKIANAPAAAELIDPGKLLRGRVNLIARTPDPRSTQMVFELAQAGSSEWWALGTARAPFHLSVDTGRFIDGSYELRIESVNAEGLSAFSRRFGPYVVDNTPPAIKIVKPAQGETLRSRAELLVEVSDEASGPALVELSYNDGDEWITLAGLEPEEGVVRGFWQLADCRPGSCRVRATAFDRAGNEASEEITVTIAASASVSPKPEPASEPETVAPSQAQAAPALARPRSAPSSGRFGQVPSWDWKHQRAPGGEQAGGAASGPPGGVTVPLSRVEPAAPEGAKSKPIEPARPKERVGKSVAWTWKPSSPRSEPELGEEPEPEEEPANRPGAEKNPKAGTARDTEEESEPTPQPKAEPEPEPEPKSEPEPRSAQENEPEEGVKPALKQTARDLRLVEPMPEEKPAEAADESDAKPAGAEDGGRLVNVDFARAARGWDIWVLSALVDDTPDQDPAREEERRQVLYHLRQHSSVDGRIPPGFEQLIYEVFGELMPSDEGA